MLVLFSGLPGSGKSSLSRWVGRALGAPVLSVDVVEAAMHEGGLPRHTNTTPAVHAVVASLAAKHLAAGLTVLVDTVLPYEEDRDRMRQLAGTAGVGLAVVEVVCSDVALHREHYLSRPPLVPYHRHEWGHVERVAAVYAPWSDERLVLDAVDPVDLNGQRALTYLRTVR